MLSTQTALPSLQQDNKENAKHIMFFETESSVQMCSLAILENLPMFGITVHGYVDREIQRRLRQAEGPSAEHPLRCHMACNERPAGVKRRVYGSNQRENAGRDMSVDSNTPRNMSDAGDTANDESATISRAGSFEDSQSSSGLSARTRVGWKDCKDAMHTCHRSFLVKRIYDLEHKLEHCKSELAKSKRSYKATNKQCGQLMVKLSSEKPVTDEAALTIQKKVKPDGQTGSRCTVRGFLALGIRKSMAVTSALGFPMSALVDVSRQTVTRAETTIWSVLIARTGMFHTLMRERLRKLAGMYVSMQTSQASRANEGTGSCDGDDPAEGASQEALVCVDLGFAGRSNAPPASEANVLVKSICVRGNATNDDLSAIFCMGGTALAGDATNSGIWRRSKLQGLLLTSAFMVDTSYLQSETEYMRAFAFHTTVLLERMPSPQRVVFMLNNISCELSS